MKFFYDTLTPESHRIDLLEVHSFEMNVYLVSITVGIQSGMIYDKSDKPKRFHSAGQIRQTFQEYQVEKAVMVHDTPYDEMIGNPPKAKHSAALPFSMELPY